MREKKSVEDNHGDALTEDNTYGNNLFSLIFSEYYRNGCKTWVAQKPENAGFGKGDIEFPFQRASLHCDDLVKTRSQRQS